MVCWFPPIAWQCERVAARVLGSGIETQFIRAATVTVAGLCIPNPDTVYRSADGWSSGFRAGEDGDGPLWRHGQVVGRVVIRLSRTSLFFLIIGRRSSRPALSERPLGPLGALFYRALAHPVQRTTQICSITGKSLHYRWIGGLTPSWSPCSYDPILRPGVSRNRFRV